MGVFFGTHHAGRVLAAQYCGNSAILYAAVGLALIANIFGFKTREFFQLEEGEAAARQPVKVQF